MPAASRSFSELITGLDQLYMVSARVTAARARGEKVRASIMTFPELFQKLFTWLSTLSGFAEISGDRYNAL